MHTVIEIRTYQLHQGEAQRFHEAMQQRALPLLRAAGTDVLAAMASLDDPSVYMLVRAYGNAAERATSQAAFYGSAAWLNGPRENILACIATYHSVLVPADAALIASMRRIEG